MKNLFLLRVDCYLKKWNLYRSFPIRAARGGAYYKSQSYYPEFIKDRKSSFRIWCEQMLYLLRYGCFNDFYFLYGFDIKGFHKQKDYMFYDTFFLHREYLNNKNELSLIPVLRDKLLFYCYANALSIPTPKVIGIIENGVLYQLYDDTATDLYEYIVKNDFSGFIKSIDGECGQGVFVIETSDGNILVDDKNVTDESFISLFKGKGRFIMQEKITNQHPAISALHPQSVNTIRLITIHTQNDEYVMLPPLLRVGTGGNKIDNWFCGGLAIGIDTSNNCLREYGFRKPTYGGKVDKHPDTDIVLKGYHIPYLQESISMAISLHKKFSTVHSIGWDIAITTDGPVFIEGNDNWEISLMQACSYGLKKEMLQYFS